MTTLLLLIIYLAFISLGLPDPLLGGAWPTMQQEFQVPMSYAGGISMIIAAGTIVSSLLSDRLTRKLGTGKITAFSVALTAIALLGFSFSHAFWMLCLWAIPYGLGAGSVDASLNNYVALHYASRHMSWLHCMWGVGTAIGPYILSYALLGGGTWNTGYRYVFYLQIILTVILFLSLPLWKSRNEDLYADPQSPAESKPTDTEKTPSDKPLSLREIIRIRGAKEVMIIFFCYCALEQTAMLWASSYLVGAHGFSAQKAAGYASMFCIGITIGRAISGFLTIKLHDTAMVRLGIIIIAIGVLILLLPLGGNSAVCGLVIIGLGCAPIYPCIIHSTPAHFGADKSQAIIGVQMATAYIGICVMPPLFGLLANHISVSLFPVYLLILLVIMGLLHERLAKISG